MISLHAQMRRLRASHETDSLENQNMKKIIAFLLVFGIGLIIGAAGGGGAMAYANSSLWERWYDTGAAECLQRVGHVAHVRAGESERAIEHIDQAIAAQVAGLLGRAEVVPAPASREYGENQHKQLRLIHTYMQIYPDAFARVLQHPGLAEFPPYPIDEVRVLCDRSGLCTGQFAALLQHLKEVEKAQPTDASLSESDRD